MAVFSLGQAAPHLQSVAEARGAAYTLWNIIDSVNIKFFSLTTKNLIYIYLAISNINR